MKGIEGLTLGRYELRRRIAHGGMAEVYVAYDRRVRRQVAIKVLYGRDESFVRRFEREALAVGALSHDHILPLYDFGEQSPWYYLVMPYVEGGTLRDYLQKRKRLTMEETASFLDQIASALQHAHDHGVLHRDVKPSNILLRPDGYAYLADFGLAKAIMGAESLTGDGTIVGTPEYMAPEQSNGVNDYRSDIYSLGVILFQMLTGRVPFTAESPVAIFLRHIQAPVPSPREFNSEIPASVEEVVFKALAKDPNERYQEAQELSSAYWKALQQEQVRGPVLSPLPVTNVGEGETVSEPSGEPTAESEQDVAEQETQIVPDAERAIIRPPATPQLFPLTELPEEAQAPQSADEDTERIAPVGPAQVSVRKIRRVRPRYLVLACLAVLIVLVPFFVYMRQPAAHTIPPPTQQHLSPQQVHATQTAIAQAQLQATQVARAHAQATAGITDMNVGDLLYSYDLKNPGGGWSDYGRQCYFSGQAYHVQTAGAHQAAWCFTSQTQITNAVIKVQGRLLRGDFWGLVFRLNPNAQNFYVLEINNQGQYRFISASGTDPQNWLTLIDWTHADAIKRGYGETNMLMVQASGSSFRFYANNQLLLARFSDKSYSSGLVGMLVGGDSGPTEAAFNNIYVFQALGN